MPLYERGGLLHAALELRFLKQLITTLFNKIQQKTQKTTICRIEQCNKQRFYPSEQTFNALKLEKKHNDRAVGPPSEARGLTRSVSGPYQRLVNHLLEMVH